MADFEAFHWNFSSSINLFFSEECTGMKIKLMPDNVSPTFFRPDCNKPKNNFLMCT